VSALGRTEAASALELHAVSKEYGASQRVLALRDVSLVVGHGELVALVGPSGSGKTTLLSIAGTLERPSAGEVRIAGRSVAALGDRALAGFRSRHIGFVFQQFFLLPTLSALDNVASGLLYRGEPVSERRAAAARVLELVGLGHRLGHRPNQLSGGECQRVAIARAVVGDPAIVFADEPTGNLDTASGTGILELLEQLAATGTTIVVATHSAEVAAASSRVVYVRDGAIERDERAARAELSAR
jgi:putative ABC transport system ATP-binding protein